MPISTRALRNVIVFVLAAGVAVSASATTTSKKKAGHHKVATTHHSASHHTSRHSKTASRSHGQRTIDEQRTVAIQDALIREHYLSGEPSGAWDQATRDAMTRYQAANGWQTKITPDSRALIKLGLGPDHKGLLNPETANIATPHELGVDNATQPGGATDTQ